MDLINCLKILLERSVLIAFCSPYYSEKITTWNVNVKSNLEST